jgi:hypothetical protein
MSQDFVGRSRALSADGFAAVTGSLAVQAPELWSVLSVETSGHGFLSDRRPQILYERHFFHRLTGGQFDDGDISDPQPGGYLGGAREYERLARAIALDRGAALRSASWGLGQIMGDNFVAAGFADVEAMVAAMSDSEDAQLTAVGAFLKASRLDAPLQAHDWQAFARGYNGPSFQKNEYDKKLQQQFEKFSAGALPDLTVRAAQVYLTFLDLEPGSIDGIMGRKTRTALADFQNQQGLAAGGDLDAALLDTLMRAALA